MSIIKNQYSSSDASLSIVSMGTIPGTSYSVRKCATFTDKCFDCNGIYAFTDDTVIIQASVASGVTGYLYGIINQYSTNMKMYIQVTSTTVTWVNGATTKTHTREDGVHLYGFVDGKAWYDGTFLSEAAVSVSALTGYVAIGGVHTVNGVTHVSYTPVSSAVIYRAIYAGRRSNRADKAKQIHSYYPCASGSTAVIYDARYRRSTATLQGSGSITLDTDTTFKYGVSIDDLRVVFNSSYHDLLAIVCEDDGKPDAGADAADIVTDGQGHTFRSAFRLKGTDGTTVPLPSGWSVQNRGTDKVSYNKGDLICGRHPRWHIWADGINIGRYTETISSKNYIKYNLFHTPAAASGSKSVRLEDFDGYNNANSVNRAPTFEILGDYGFEFHNKVLCYCTPATKLPVYGGSSSVRDDRSIYYSTVNQFCAARAKIGNLADWNMTRDHITNNPLEYHTGMAVTFHHDIPSVVSNLLIASVWKVTDDKGSDGKLLPFCSASSQATKDLFRDGKVGGVETPWPINYQLGYNDTYYNNIYNEINSNGYIDAKMQLSLINSATVPTSLTDGNLVYTDRILPFAYNSVRFPGSVDRKDVSSSTTYRCILKTPTVTISGTKYYIYTVAMGASESERNTRYAPTNAANGGFRFFFCLWTTDPSTSGGSIVSNASKSMTMNLKMTKNTSTPVVKTFSTSVKAFNGSNSYFRAASEDISLYTVFPDGAKYINSDANAKLYLFMGEIKNSDLTDIASSSANIPDNVTVEVEIV